MNKSSQILPIIDWEHETQLAHNTIGLTNELLILFANQLPETQKAINQAYMQKNYRELYDRLHKLQGGCVYCGLLRLKTAIAEALSAIRESNVVSQDFMDQINHEMNTVMNELRSKGIIN